MYVIVGYVLYVCNKLFFYELTAKKLKFIYVC